MGGGGGKKSIAESSGGQTLASIRSIYFRSFVTYAEFNPAHGKMGYPAGGNGRPLCRTGADCGGIASVASPTGWKNRIPLSKKRRGIHGGYANRRNAWIQNNLQPNAGRRLAVDYADLTTRLRGEGTLIRLPNPLSDNDLRQGGGIVSPACGDNSRTTGNNGPCPSRSIAGEVGRGTSTGSEAHRAGMLAVTRRFRQGYGNTTSRLPSASGANALTPLSTFGSPGWGPILMV